MEREKSDGILTLTASLNISVETSIVHLCTAIKDELIPENNQVEWDYFRVEIWGDSGRVIVYPASMNNPYRIEKLGCQMVSEQLLNEYEELADAEMSDDEFTSSWLQVVHGWSVRVANTCASMNLVGIHLMFFDADEEDAVLDITVPNID